MRILFIHEILGIQGGAEANVLQVAKAFRKRGHELAFFFEKRASGEGAFREVFDVLMDEFEEIARWKPDVIFMHKVRAMPLLKKVVNLEVSVVKMVHDHEIYCQRGARYFPWNRRICSKKAGYHCALTCGVLRNREGPLPVQFAWPGVKMQETALTRQCDRFLVQTDFMQGELELHDFPKDAIEVIPVIPEPMPKVERQPDPEGLILFVGQVIRGKGVDVLLDALKRIESARWKCVIAGTGTHLDFCVDKAKTLGLSERVTFAGHLEKSDLRELYTSATLGVIPSLWPEPMGMVGLEFMRQAIPMVGFQAGGIGQYLRDGENGFIVPVWEVKQFAASMNALLEDDALALQMGRAGQQISDDEFGFEAYIERLEAIFTEV